MPFRFLQTRLADHRAVIIPAGLDAEQRERFVTKVAAAARQQAGLAAASPGVLKVSGDIVERGDTILIPHEPATPLDPAAVELGERPAMSELWWAAWALLGALRAAAAENAPHGGIQTGSVFVDETGRLKLSDFGIAPVFEAVCGGETRRQIHCEAAIREDSEQRVLSGEWSLLPEEETRDHGWIAPFFAHELLEGKVRLNPRSDQFALGTLLFLLATGTHPYEAALCDPTLMFYFVLEPHPLEHGRPDWSEIFERRSKGLSQSADKPVLAWSDLVMRLLAADSSQRFPDLAEAEKLIREHVPSVWNESAAALSQAQALLEAGDVEGCLSRVVRWRGHEALPAQWRERLTAWVDRVGAQKELIVRRRELSAMLAEAQKHVDLADASRAMALAQSVKDAPEADESQRRAADEILVLCSDIDALNKSEWAPGYLDAAQELFARRQFSDARELLTGLLQDPGTPPARRTQARQLLSDVELAEQRIERQKAELAAAREELGAGKFDSARPRLEGLLSSGDISEELAGESRGLLTELQRREGIRAANLSLLADAREAWERGEAELLERKLAQVKSDFADPQVAGPSAELSGRLAALRDGLAARREAEEALARQDADTALRRARQGAAIPGLPAVLAEALAALVQRGQQLTAQLRELSRAVEEEKQGAYDAAAQRIERLLEQAELPGELASQARLLLEDIRATQQRLAKYADQLKAAGAAWEAGDLPLLEQRLADFTVDPGDRQIVQARQHLVGRAELLRTALDAKKAAESALAAGDAATAHATARREAEREELPQIVRNSFADLLRRCEQVLAARRREAVERALRELEAARAVLEKAEIAECRRRVQQVLDGLPDAPGEVRSPAEELLAACTYVERARDVLGEAEQAGSRGEFDLARARLDQLDRSKLPAAVQEQLERIGQEIQRREAEFRRGQEKVAAETLELARVDLNAGRLEQAERRLAEVRSSRFLTDALRRLLSEVERGLEQARPIAQTLAAVEKLLAAGGETELDDARKRLGTLPAELPFWARERGDALRERSDAMLKRLREQRVQAASAALDAANEALERGEPQTARQKIEESRPGLALDASLAGRAEQLRLLAQQIEAWLPRVQDLRRRLVNKDLAAVAREAAEQLEQPNLPRAVARQLDELVQEAHRGIEQHRARLDQELALLSGDLEKAGRRARRFIPRAEAVRSDGLATEKHKEQAELLLRRFEALPRPRMPLAPLAVSGAVGLVAIGAAIYWFGAGLGGGPTALPGPHDGEKPAANGSQESSVPVGPNPGPAPKFAEMDAGREAQARADAEMARAARDRLQQTLDAARAQADPAAPVYRVMIDVLDGGGAQVYVTTEDRKTTAVLLENIAIDELASARLPEAWLAATYPPLASAQDANEPPIEPIRPLAERLLDELASRLGPGFDPPALIPSKAGEYAVEVAAERRTLRVGGVRLDEQADRVTPDVAEILACLQLQEEAIAALGTPTAIGFDVHPQYDKDLVALDGVEQAAEFGEGCDAAGGRLELTIPARLRTDPSGESFPLHGSFSVRERRLAADENGRAFFRGYLKRLQERAAYQAAEALGRDLALPEGMRVTAVAREAPEQIELEVGPTGKPLVTAAAPWNPGVLAYQVDVDGVRASLARALYALAASPEVRAALSASWPALRERLALPAGQAGRVLVERFTVQELRAKQPDRAAPFVIPVEVVLSDAEALGDGSFTLRTNLRAQGDSLGWDEGQLEAIRKQIAAHFDALARDEDLVARRQAAVLGELSREKGLPAAELRVLREGDVLKVEWTAGQTVHAVAWSWDRETLDWAGRKDLPPARLAPAKLEERLARLSTQSQAELSELAGAVREIARRKLERYQARGLEPRLAEQDSRDPREQLLAISQALQALVAPNRASDPFPTVFVEYFSADDAVYGLSWHVSTDQSDNLIDVHRGRIWKAADCAELLGSSAEELRRRYSSPGDKLAASLLTPAFEGGVTASARPGDGSFGVIIAPDGPLWLTRWEQVHAGPLAVVNLGPRSAPPAGTVHALWDLLRPQPFPYDDRAQVARRRAGLWVVPALAAVCREGPEQAVVQLGRITPDNEAPALSFRPWGEATKFFAATVELTGTGDRGFQWGAFVRRLSRENAGTLFWEYGWESGQYQPKRVRSLVLLPLAP